MTCVERLYAAICHASVDQVRAAADDYLHPNVRWHVAHPVDDLLGPRQVADEFLLPLCSALPDLERRPLIQFVGNDRGQRWVCGTGFFAGRFVEPLHGIPPSNKALALRYTELLRIEDERIIECFIIPDFLDVMYQVGVCPVRLPLGYAGQILPPATLDGIRPEDADPGHGAVTKQLVMDMLDCLRRYDGLDLGSMDLENYWHPDFFWYGPGGIGTTRGIQGFRQQHQGPFLRAFPDRDVDNHACTVASGDYVATGGWPHMHGTHSGNDWLGLPASGRHLSLRVMDIWRREGSLLRENWVAIDIPNMLMQMGYDVFSDMRSGVSIGEQHG